MRLFPRPPKGKTIDPEQGYPAWVKKVAATSQELFDHMAEDNQEAHKIANIKGLESALEYKGKTFDLVLDKDNWAGSGDGEDEPPFIQEVEAVGIIDTDRPFIDLVVSDDPGDAEQEMDNWGKVYKIITEEDKIIVYAQEEPKIDLNIQVMVVR